MKSMLTQLLFEPVPAPPQRGRSVRFDVDEPQIMVATGPLDERIATFMRLRGYPMTAREISAGIGSNPSQVNKGLHTLIGRGVVEAVEIPGSVKEYVLLID
ncbi:MAG: hypothetical protein FGM35_01005 [Rhodocyclaceae bacterium]|jgi:hypothetical protein|nr:hypothetical protein [Rhodocyclaceae bacterium]